ncbi:inner membrane complex suture component, putative [Plasmodium vinckei petteri]|uniref:Choline transporter-like protein n=1 Tax=Plasmodium vinckei petteri TaxID=138298 RepID=A0A6V7T203_PLAVN|nr:inner membrane complex suture component, putative [Plasmodium vinckei petteri]
MADDNENRTSGYEMLIEVPNTNENDEKNYYEIYGNNKTNEVTNNNHIFENNNERNNQNFELGSPLNYTIGSPEEPFEKYCYNINEKKKIETDIKYYGHFFVSLIFLGFFILYYIYYGDYSRILYGTNYNGRVCGKDLNSFKYLYYPLSPKTSKFEILKNYPKCLESCPTVENANDNKTDEENLDVEKKKKNFFEDNFFFPFKKNSDKNKGKIMDKSGNIETNVVYADYTKGPNNNLYVEYSLNSKYYDTVNIMNICYPRDKTLREKVINILDLDLDTNGNSKIVSLQKVFYYFKSSYIFSMIWISVYFYVCEMLQSLNQFTICHLGTMWYFSDKKKIEGSRNVVEEMNFILNPMSKIVDMYTTSAYCEMSMTSHPYMISCHLSSKKLTNSTSPAAALHGISYITNIIFPGFSTMIITFFAFNIFNNFKMYNNIFSPSYIPNPFFSALIIGLICGIITSYFITIISTLADTFLYCFICECYQKQMIDENPLRKTFTPDLLREFILEIYEDYNSKL